MTNNLLSKGELNYFYESRKKLDQAIGQILGHDNHLHDISATQSSKSNNSLNKLSKELFNIKNKKPEQLEHYFTGSKIDNKKESKMQKLQRENIQFQKMILNLEDEIQNLRYRSNLWERVKEFIVGNNNRYYQLQNLKILSSDSAILDEFLPLLADCFINRKDSKNKNSRDPPQNRYQKREQMQNKLKLEQERKKVLLLTKEIEKLKGDKKTLNSSENILETEVFNQLEKAQSALVQKIKQNSELAQMVKDLEKQIKLLRDKSITKKDKTISTSIPASEALKSRKSIGKWSHKFQQQNYQQQDENINQIQRLQQQSKDLSLRIEKLQSKNDKMKKVIRLARTLNNQFLQKLQNSMKRDPFANSDSGNEYNLKRAPPTGLDGNNRESSQSKIQVTNFRFKIVKSKSLQKDRFVYGKSSKN